MNWTEEQVREAEQRMKGGDALRHQKPLVSQARNAAPAKDVAAGAKKTRGMNGWETQFSYELEAMRQAGSIVWWQFEGIRFRLADGAWFKPDFADMSKDGVLTVTEIKGHWRESARLRIKVAADRHPFRFVALRKRKAKEGGGWDREEFSAMLDRISQ